MAGRGVDDARAVLKRDVVGVDEHALLARVAKDGLGVTVARKLGAGGRPAGNGRVVPAELLAAALGERLTKDERAALVLDGDVGGLGVEDHGVVGGQGPRRGGPDGHV